MIVHRVFQGMLVLAAIALLPGCGGVGGAGTSGGGSANNGAGGNSGNSGGTGATTNTAACNNGASVLAPAFVATIQNGNLVISGSLPPIGFNNLPLTYTWQLQAPGQNATAPQTLQPAGSDPTWTATIPPTANPLGPGQPFQAGDTVLVSNGCSTQQAVVSASSGAGGGGGPKM